MLKTIIWIVVIAVVLFIALLIITIMPRSKNAAKYEPYKTLLGNSYTTERETFLIVNDAPEKKFVDYRLYDTGYIHSAIVDAALERWMLPAGTVLTFEKAKIYENGVSGLVRGFVIGFVRVPETEDTVAFEYMWGEKKSFYDFDNRKNDYHWVFPFAPWQKEPDTNTYKLPARIY